MEMIFAVVVFFVCIVLLFIERFDNTMVVLAGAILLIATGILSWEEAIHAIDFEMIALLLGLMLMVGIVQHSGIFSWINTKIATASKGNPLAIFLMLIGMTALASTFLNNVTVVILMIPIAIALAKNLGMDSKLIVIALAMFSNIGGTLTLIGDPPNTLIGIQAHLSFMDFIENLWIPVLLTSVLVISYMLYVYKHSFRSISKNLTQSFVNTMAVRRVAYQFLEKGINKYVSLASILVLIGTILAFVFQPWIGISIGVIGLISGAVLAIITYKHVPFQKALHEVEWDSLLFFVALFVQVGALEKVGFLEVITNFISQFADNYALLLLMIIWVIGLASTVINTIPFVALMIPVIYELQAQMAGQPDLDLLWWALALAACLGANGTVVGSSASYIAVELAKKHGINISTIEFAKVGMPVTIISLIAASVFILGRLYI